ncbi:MAG: DUF6883 domain-containing protein [Chloroflexota bacterium]
MPERLPNADNARIDPRKLRDYALNTEHVSGRHKAAFFAQMGYTADDWQRLERDIRAQHLSQQAEPGKGSPFGRKYIITAPLQGPVGAPRYVTTVWIIRPDNDYAELVTIMPATRQEEIEDGSI